MTRGACRSRRSRSTPIPARFGRIGPNWRARPEPTRACVSSPPGGRLSARGSPWRSRATTQAARLRCLPLHLRRFGPLTLGELRRRLLGQLPHGPVPPRPELERRRSQGAVARGGRSGRHRPVRVHQPAGALGRRGQSAGAAVRRRLAQPRLRERAAGGPCGLARRAFLARDAEEAAQEGAQTGGVRPRAPRPRRRLGGGRALPRRLSRPPRRARRRRRVRGPASARAAARLIANGALEMHALLAGDAYRRRFRRAAAGAPAVGADRLLRRRCRNRRRVPGRTAADRGRARRDSARLCDPRPRRRRKPLQARDLRDRGALERHRPRRHPRSAALAAPVWLAARAAKGAIKRRPDCCAPSRACGERSGFKFGHFLDTSEKPNTLSRSARQPRHRPQGSRRLRTGQVYHATP